MNSIDKLDLRTPDFVSQNIEKLAALFPHCVTETADGRKIDFDLLQQELSHDIVEGNRERYRLEWPGKREAIVTANLPTTKTLRPVREDSVDFDNTENLYIEGDNLEVLKLLQESYRRKIKMIYIDPPYNTGNDFVYKDNFATDRETELFESGQIDEYGKRMVANPETSGRYHSDWLTMMYPRLKLARNLLADDGVMVVHIDENEYTNLEKLLDEIFGENNNLGTIVWDKRNPKGEVVGVAQQHELISLYSKNKEVFKEKCELKRPKENADKIIKKANTLIKANGKVDEKIKETFKKWLSEQPFSNGEKAYNLIDENGSVYQTVSMAAPDKPETRSHRPLIHPVTGLPCPVPAKGWRFPDSSMDLLLKNNEIVFGDDENTQPRRKYLLENNLYENVPSLLYFGGSDNALTLPFDNPKPVIVSKKIIESIINNNDIILDFFSGSATTAHAVMQLNAEDGGKRKFIMVQLPEQTDEKSEAYKAGYKNICEIGKERIRRASKTIVNGQLSILNDNNGKLSMLNGQLEKMVNGKLLMVNGKYAFPNGLLIDDTAERLLDEINQLQEKINNLQLTINHYDNGFRVYRLADSNMQDVYYRSQDYKQNMLDIFADNIKPDRTADDLLAQVMLDWGLPLSYRIEQIDINGKQVFRVAQNSLLACFDTGIDEAFAKAVAKEKPLRVVFRDSGFASDTAKINVQQLLKQLSPETEMKVI